MLAVRPGSIVNAADLDFESDEDEDGNTLEVYSPALPLEIELIAVFALQEAPQREPYSDYWLCWVVERYKKGPAEVDGIEIGADEGYAMVQWMVNVRTDASGGRYFEKEEGLAPAVLFEAGSVIPMAVGSHDGAQKEFFVSGNKHDQLFIGLQQLGA